MAGWRVSIEFRRVSPALAFFSLGWLFLSLSGRVNKAAREAYFAHFDFKGLRVDSAFR